MKAFSTLVFIASLIPAGALAQRAATHELRTVDGSPVTHLKLAHATVASFDAEGQVSFHGDRMKVVIDGQVAPQALIQRLAQNGAGDFVCVQCTTKPRQAAATPDALPPLGNNDPASQQQLAIDKQQWAAEHPEAHEQYIRALREATPVSHE